MTFPTVASAETFIRSNLQAFYDNSRVLRDRLLSIGKLLQAAKQQNNQDALGKLIVLQSQTKEAFNEQLRIEQQLQPFADYFGVKQTLNALPVVLGLAALAVAAAMYVQFEKVRTQGKALDLVAQGVLTPAEAAKITDSTLIGVGGGIGLALPVVAGLGFLLFWMGAFRR